MTKHTKTSTYLAIALSGVLSCSFASASTILDKSYDPFHIQYGQQSNYDHVGKIYQYNNTKGSYVSTPYTKSTGVLIGDRWVLTAAHNVTDPDLPDTLETSYYEVYFNNRAYAAKRWFIPSDFNYEPIVGADIAVIELTEAVDSEIQRAQINRGVFDPVTDQFLGYETVDPHNRDFNTVGYGVTNVGEGAEPGSFPNSKYGTKRYFHNVFDIDRGNKAILTTMNIVGSGNFTALDGRMLFSDFDSDFDGQYAANELEGEGFNWETDYAKVLEGLGAPGDSGAPNLDGTNVVMGISSQRILGNSNGPESTSEEVDIMVSTDVARWSSWIDRVMNNTYSDSEVQIGTVGDEIVFDSDEDWTYIGYKSLAEYKRDRFLERLDLVNEYIELKQNNDDLTNIKEDLADEEISFEAIEEMMSQEGFTPAKISLYDKAPNFTTFMDGDQPEINEDDKLGFTFEELHEMFPDAGFDALIPEPTTLSLLSLAGLAMLRRRK